MNLENRLSQGKEIKEAIPQHEIAFAFVKPDFLENVPDIEKIIEENGLDVIYKDKVRLSGEAVDHIYQNLQSAHFYPTMKKYLMENDVMVMLIGGRGHEAQRVLLKLKKEEGKDGVLRRRFRKEPLLDPEEFELWQKGEHPKQDTMTTRITQGNVIHTADNAEDAIKSLKLIIGDKFETMKKQGNLPAELWDLFNEEKLENQNIKNE
jgi:nucleoside diphosphate kinase